VSMGPPTNSRDAPKRLLIIGLDSAPPDFFFDRVLPFMPNVQRLLKGGVRAPLRTTDPPVSVPAWPVMFTGVDPGTLGFYGFRHRMNHSYTRYYTPTSTLLPVPTLWKLASDRGKRVAVIGMPPGYPPPKVNGCYISDFLTPDGARDYAYPDSLRTEIESKWGSYEFDVVFRADERVQLYENIRRMTEKRFSIAEELYQRERWDIFAIHEIGVDRIHHAYTKYFDRNHAEFQAGNPFEHVAEEYYGFVDAQMGRLLKHIDDETLVVVASDHGSMPMEGCFCINQWLVEKGYLTLRETPKPGTPLEKSDVDWSRTTVWSAGGYYARIFFNLAGREANGVVPPEGLSALRERLVKDLLAISGPDGRPLGVQVLDPRTVYHTVRGDPPDLMVYFGDLKWRSAGTMGHPSNYLRANDTGPDDAVHGREGVLVLFDPRVTDGRELPSQAIIDVTPTLLSILGEPIPAHVQGKPIPEARPRAI
jgi:predicted AlkP superfamily phosphohydrolase/phosphomutase